MAQSTTPGGIAIEYETAGLPTDPPLLLVAGYASQLISWPRAFCERLAGGGRSVISFDNRDCGLSSKLEGRGAEPSAVIAAASQGDLPKARKLAAYTLSEMAKDALALLDALGIEQAHVVGASMGAMIAQTMAIEHPGRLLTLTSIMSNTGEPDHGRSTPQALQALLTPPPSDRAGFIDAAERTLTWRSKRYPELAEARRLAGESYDRCYCPQGTARQFAAIMASGSRAEGLTRLGVPTLVMHGLDDTLIEPSGGRRTAELVPGARLMLIEDMGHDRPRPLWPKICGAILQHTR
ncbi:MAG: alpha/beta fold hydrolase [Solirubrobacteraceae bacterium]